MNSEKKNGTNDVREGVFIHLKLHHAKQIILFSSAFVILETFLLNSYPDIAIIPPVIYFILLIYLWVTAEIEIEKEFWKEFAKRNNYTHEETAEVKRGAYAESRFLNLNTSWTKITRVKGKWREHPLSFFGFTTPINQNNGKRELVFTVCEMKILQKVPSAIITHDIDLATPVVHIIRSFPNHAKLALEGDFNKFFTVYVEDGKERDLLEILTPDVMEKLISYKDLFTFEFHEDTLLVIAEKRILKRSELDAMNEAAQYLVEKVPRYFIRSSSSS